MSDSPVFLLTHSDDFYTIDLVQAALEARGARAVRVNTDTFPVELGLVVEGDAVTFELAGELVRLTESSRVWLRRLWPGRMPEDMDPKLAHHATQQSRRAFFDALELVDGPRWMNSLGAQKRAENKLVQLKEARALGLEIPRTVVTNRAEPVRALGGPLATKLLGALSQTMDGSGDFVFTSRLEGDEDLTGLELCPQVFQPFIEKKRELRVVVVDERVFTAGIDPNVSPAGRVDWRQLRPGEASWFDAELPSETQTRVLQLCRVLGLRFAAVDVLVDADERHWFLEVNPAGEWGWLERDLGMKISVAIADALLEPA